MPDEFVCAYNCHCSNCRAMTGSAFLPWGEIERDKLRVTKGADALLVEGDPSDAHAVRCGKCWALLYWIPRDGYVRVPYGTLLDEPALKPTAHMFVGSKAPWHEILDDLPQHDEYPWQ
ncbi:MAG: GFA family protein [Gaiellaceae bacterium]